MDNNSAENTLLDAKLIGNEQLMMNYTETDGSKDDPVNLFTRNIFM